MWGPDRVWGREPGAACRIATAEPACQLAVTLFGKPVQGDVGRVQVKGASAERLQLQLVNAQGRVVGQLQVAQLQAIEQH